MSSPAARIVLYERDGCHLCAEAAAVLDAALGTTGYRRVNIDASDELVVRYGFRIPVVAIDGIDRFDALIDPGELARFLDAARQRR